MSDEVFDQPPQARFLRNPDAPVIYAPLVDVRVTQQGLHLLPFVPPAAAPQDVVRLDDGQPLVEIRSSAELIVPLDTAPRLIHDLAIQLKNTIIKRFKQDAAEAGLQVPPDDEIEFGGLEEIFALARAVERRREQGS